MIEIKVLPVNEIDFKVNDTQATHLCIMKEGQELLGIAGMKQEDIDSICLLYTEMKREDSFLFDGLVKSVVNYAFLKGFEEIEVYDEDTMEYLSDKKIHLTNGILSINEFRDNTHCRMA